MSVCDVQKDLRALPRSSVCAQDHHAVRLHVLQQTELQAPHGQLLTLLQKAVVARGVRKPIVGVDLQIGQILVVLLQVSREERGDGEIVQDRERRRRFGDGAGGHDECGRAADRALRNAANENYLRRRNHTTKYSGFEETKIL